MDSTFSFLSATQVQILNDILMRRNPLLAKRVQCSASIALSDADEIVSTLADEFLNNIDSDWEPTEYGRTVDGILGKVNAVRIGEDPE